MQIKEKNNEAKSKVAHTLWDLQPLSFYGKNEILYLVTGLYCNIVDWNIVSNIAVYYLPCA